MIHHWLKPLNQDLIFDWTDDPGRLAGVVKFTPEDIVAGKTIVLLGVDEKWANRVRRHLYSFASNLTCSTICDLGNFRKKNSEFIAPALNELILAGALPVLVGCREGMGASVLQAIRSKKPETKGVFLQEAFALWHDDDSIQTDTSYIGIQQHLLSEKMQSKIHDARISWTRLSNARNSLEESEPEIRDSGFLSFEMSAMRFSDFPAQNSYSTSGFFTEEACQLMRYSGISPEMSCICLGGHDPMSTTHNQSANTQAQLLWYMINGFDQRVVERPDSSDRFTQYLVHMQRYNFDLIFFKSNDSGRWWLKLPSENAEKVHSCAYADYLAACEDEVSDRVSRLVEMSLDRV